MFQHSFAHQWLAAGGNEEDLQRIAVSSPGQMLQGYGPSADDQRGKEGMRAKPTLGESDGDAAARRLFQPAPFPAGVEWQIV
jgi:hypothetical protein